MGLESDEAAYVGSNFLRCVSYAILTVQVYDWIRSITFEIGHLWRGPLSLVKCQYFYSRYMGLLVQVIQVCIFNRLYHLEASSSVPRATCHLWFFFQMVGSQTLLLSLELTAIHRLYVIYDQNERLLLMLGTMVGLEATVNFALQFTYVPQVDTTGICVPRHFPLQIALIPLMQASTQVIIWALTLRRAGRIRIPILTLIARDGSRTLFALLVVFSVVMGQVVLENMEAVRPNLSPLFFPMFVLVVSLATCRMIENMDKMTRQVASDERDSTTSIDSTGIPLVVMGSARSSLSNEDHAIPG